MGQVTANFSAVGLTEGCGTLAVEFIDNSTGSPTIWWWDFGNGLTSTDQNPTIFYDTPGLYDVHLKVSDSTSIDTLTLQSLVRVFAVPSAQIQLLNNTECAPMAAQFVDASTSSAPIVSWFWDFGDGGNDALQNPNYVYQNDGAFSVSLLVVDSNTCQDLVTEISMAKVLEIPVIDFTVSPSIVCDSTTTVLFANNSTGSNNIYKWNLGDGTIDLQESPSYAYHQTGLFNVELLAASDEGCSDTLLVEGAVRVLPELLANIVASNTEICDSVLAISFDASANGANQFVWDFGDLQSDTIVNPSHTYVGYGVYDVSLDLSFDGNCSNTISSPALVRLNPDPLVDFVADTLFSCDLPFEVMFNTPTSNIFSYSWAFGDGGSSSLESPSHTYTQEGEFDVSLSVVDSNSCQSAKTIQDLIRIEPINIGFVVSDNQGCFPLEISFVDTSISTDPIVAWSWDFGDGVTATTAAATHSYTAAGLYDVALEIVSANACVEQLTLPAQIKVSEPAATQFYVADTIVCASDPVLFTDESISAELIDNWIWDFGDGSSSNEQHPTHLFQDTGYVDISLITSVGGCLDTLRIPSLVYVASPAISFMDEHTCELPYKVVFDPVLIGADSWVWDLGDGNASTQAGFSHDYADRGEYLVKLTAVNNASGCVTEKSRLVKVSEPEAQFEVDSFTPAVGCPPLYVKFRDLSIDQYFDFFWYGDGDSSNWMYFKEYQEPGFYAVQQLVIDEYGCRDTLRIDSMIHVIDVSAEIASPSLTSCFPFTMELNDQSISTDSIISWSWNTSDGQSFMANNPSVTFLLEGDYDVSLSVKTQYGCMDSTAIDNLITYDKPFVSITASDSVLCESQSLQLDAYTEGVQPGLLWDLGNGETATDFSLTTAYVDTGAYFVSVVLTDSFDCTDFAQYEVSVSRPSAQFSAASVSSNCPPLITQFNDGSSPGVVSWIWNFGDGAVSSVSDPSHLYAASGDYDVSLVVADTYGCRDTLLQSSVVSIMGPYGTFTPSDTSVCTFEPIDFSTAFINTVSAIWNFDDGSFATGMLATHAYDTLGSYLPMVLIENAAGCQELILAEDSIRVSSNTINLELSPDTTICQYEAAQININSNGSIVSWTPTVGLSDTTILNPLANPLVTTDYVVVLADGYCFNKDTITITVDEELPLPDFSYSALCVGSEVQFEDQSNPLYMATYSWDFNDGNYSELADPVHTYNTVGQQLVDLQITYDSTSCSAMFSDTVYVHELPLAEAGLDQTICETDSASLVATGGVLYDWGSGFVLDPVLDVSPLVPTTYQLTVLDDNGCVNNDVVTVFVNPAPLVHAGFDQSICEGDSLLISGSGTGALYWNGATVPSLDYLFSGTASEALHLEVVDSNNCREVDSVLVTVHHLPEMVVDYPKTLCLGTEYFFEALSVNAALSPSLFWNFSNGEEATTVSSDQSFLQEGSASFELLAVSIEGCENNYLADDLMVYANPQADFSFPAHGITDLSPEVPFYNQSTDVLEQAWDFGDGYMSTDYEPVHVYEAAGDYLVQLSVVNAQGCVASVEKNLGVETDYRLFVPNAFTPNGDDIDEVFSAQGYGVFSFRMIVFNRWGEEIYLTEDIQQGWDGSLPNLDRANSGTYSYRIMTEDARGKLRTYHGELNLIL